MATYRRECVPGATWLFTAATYRRQRLLTRPPVLAALRQSVAVVREAHPIRVVAWVVLPDHLHTIWTLPNADADFARRWALIKRRVSQSVCDLPLVDVSASMRKRGEFGLWQRRFWEHPSRDDRDLCHDVDYVHFNPVRHGYVNRVRDWPHSSFARFVEQGTYPLDWGDR